MKKTKILCIIATVITLLGLLTALASLLLIDFDFNRFSTQAAQTNTYEFTEPIQNLTIDTDTSDIRFESSEDTVCRVVCVESEGLYHETSLENGTLTLKLTDTRKWYQKIGIVNNTNESVTIYLPKSEYQALTVHASTGDVTIPKDFSFASIFVQLSTGDINCAASATESIELKVSTGDINASDLSAKQFRGVSKTGDMTLCNLTVTKDVSLEADTGKIAINDLQASSLYAKSTSGDQAYTNVSLNATLTATVTTGDIKLIQTVCGESLILNATTGDITFDRSDAATLTVKTSTGEVKGTLLSPKCFYTNTSTGDVNVPQSTTGGLCEITTSTGDIKINIA